MSDFHVNQIADPVLYGDQPRLQAFLSWLRTEHPITRPIRKGSVPGSSPATPTSARSNASRRSSTPARATP
ncbi:hypothetical protein AB5I41_11145 [Sphingomonas sp. MMS24-JH45]